MSVFDQIIGLLSALVVINLALLAAGDEKTMT
jgi:hypothetical protein